jgi:hypothetical protein
MTDKLVSARLASGETVAFEVEEVDDFGGVTAVSIAIDPETGVINLEQALTGVRRAAGQVLDAVRLIAVPPDSCEIEFGVKLSGSMGAIIAKASTEANFRIKLAWTSKAGG